MNPATETEDTFAGIIASLLHAAKQLPRCDWDGYPLRWDESLGYAVCWKFGCINYVSQFHTLTKEAHLPCSSDLLALTGKWGQAKTTSEVSSKTLPLA
jgi:hypothetical protein